jgi:hypothetical protein
MKKLRSEAWLVAGLALVVSAVPAFGQPAGPQAVSPYVLATFATGPAGLSAPDSVAVLHGHVFIGYGDGHAPDGSDGLNSQVVEYDMKGNLLYTYTVPGHNDGLKVDPQTHLLWALQNEDLNPNLVIINTENHQQKEYTFGPTPHGGGYDDMVFRDCKVYISASNPANNPNTGPGIVSAHIEGNIVQVSPVLAGTASAIDLPSGQTVQLNLQDPDSMTLDPLGNIVLDSQGDQELIIVSDPGPKQRVLHLPLSYLASAGQTSVEVDDTAFVTSSEGFLLFADKGLNAVYKLTAPAFSPGVAYTAADGGPFIGRLDMTTGVITPVVTGVSNPGGMMFVNTAEQEHEPAPSSCHERDWDAH